MNGLDDFLPLLNDLYEKHLSKPMEGQVDGKAVLNEAISHPLKRTDGTLDWTQLE